MRRFTRFTDAFSKKLDNHFHALALYLFHYHFCRQHKTLCTLPAAGVMDELLTMGYLCAIMDAANPPKPRGPRKKRPIHLRFMATFPKKCYAPNPG